MVYIIEFLSCSIEGNWKEDKESILNSLIREQTRINGNGGKIFFHLLHEKSKYGGGFFPKRISKHDLLLGSSE
jgi:hypothetical protein